MKKIFYIIILLSTSFGFSGMKEDKPDIKGLISFLEKLDGNVSLKKQNLKLIKERKSPYHINTVTRDIDANSMECKFKNSYFPNAKESKVILDFTTKKTYHKMVHLKYENEDDMKHDFLAASEELKWDYLHWDELVGIQTARKSTPTDSSLIITSEALLKSDQILGYRIWKNDYDWDKHYVELNYSNFNST